MDFNEQKWFGNNTVFKTYVKGKSSGNGKAPATPVKGKEKILTFEEASKNDSFGAILNDDFIDISFDSDDLSEKFWRMAEENDWKCLILENVMNGHIHSFWKNERHRIDKGGADKKLAVGLIADIHTGSTYIPLRVKGSDRFPPSYEPDVIQEVPDELLPVNTQIDLLSLKEGDGRNDSIFRYILVLQSQLGLERKEVIHILNNTNSFIFTESLSDEELATITRKDAFEKPTFYKGKTFLHNVFGDYIIKEKHVVKIDGKIHLYQDGIYCHDENEIEKAMLQTIPVLPDIKRKEVLKYLKVICVNAIPTSPSMIAFRNGILNIDTDELLAFSPEFIITNRIPWDYNPAAYSELADKTLNKIACDDPDIRALLEECIGYCFYRLNLFRKAYILTGKGSNGKSTFIKLLESVLGTQNISALDLKNLGDRFLKASLFGKLANLGDDISDEFIADSSLFKKIVSGDRIQAEFKGKDSFDFKPYAKLVFCANEIPRIKDKTGAVLRRLLIVPFNAEFKESSKDFEPDILSRLQTQDAMEYFVKIGVEGLQRILHNNGFTKSSAVQKELDDYREYNNPIIGFFKEQDETYLFRETTADIYRKYSVYCSENGFQAESKNQFGRSVKSLYEVESVPRTINGKSVRLYKKLQ